MSEKTAKKRNWAFIVYPESLPADWIDRLKRSGVVGTISPLHDRDFNADGTKKKPHYHVILCYNGPTSYNVVSKFTKSLGGTIPIPLESIRGMYRYFTHKDNPEKAQYSESDIRTFNGFSIRDFIELTKTEIVVIKRELRDLIYQKNLTEYSDFIDYISTNLSMDYFDVASSNTLFFDRYLSSKRHKDEKEKQKKDSLN